MTTISRNQSRPLIGALDCVRPLLFTNETESYPFSIGGTCFIVEFEQRPFIVTAAHTLKNHGREPKEVAVQYDTHDSSMIPICRSFSPQEPNNPTAERTDLIILQVDTRYLDLDRWIRGHPLQIGTEKQTEQADPADSYMLGGYPSIGVEVNYDQLARHVHLTRVRMGIASAEPPPWKECLSFTAPGHPDLPEFDGLSGAPIIKVVHLDEKFSRASLGGIVTRGDKGRRLFYAISGEFVIAKLRQICTTFDLPPR